MKTDHQMLIDNRNQFLIIAAMITRIEALRIARGWQQPEMAGYLRMSQPAVSNMVRGQKESGPVEILLDQLAREIGRDDLTAERFVAPPEAGAA